MTDIVKAARADEAEKMKKKNSAGGKND